MFLTRSMLVADFAQMEMRTILTQLFKNFTFELSEKEKSAPTTELSEKEKSAPTTEPGGGQ
eukprot:COSAG04_NODE_328_length_16610_cov_3.679668_6_plen_61_part_00